MFKDSEYLQTVLMWFGVPEGIFDHADPLAVFIVFIFGQRIFIFFLSILIWMFVKFLRAHVDPNANKEKMSGGFTTHQYHDMSEMGKMYKGDKKPTFMSMAFKGFIIPVLVIFIAISIAMEMSNG